jgi:hypothetical protein
LTPGRLCALKGLREYGPEELSAGFDFRRPEYRRAVFLMFYQFHLRYRAHPGCVYYLISFLRDELNWTREQALWFAFLNGNTQNPVTSLVLMQRFPMYTVADQASVKAYLDQEWERLEFDTDRRYWKTRLPESVQRYREALGQQSQTDFFMGRCGDDPERNFRAVWDTVRREFLGFGRLSAWSYLEYLRIVGVPLEPDSMMLRDRDGSRSHRNGLCKVLGRDDLDWHDGNPEFDGRYSDDILTWLEAEIQQLLEEAQVFTQSHPDTSRFTLESTLCTYKSWHRPNRRYPNVYNDMLHGRITRAEKLWGERCPVYLGIFWDARQRCLPEHLRLECNPGDPGLCPEKQNHYLMTGEPIMMDEEYPCFQNQFNNRVRQRQAQEFWLQ